MPIVLQCRENNFSTTKPDPRNFFDINNHNNYKIVDHKYQGHIDFLLNYWAPESHRMLHTEVFHNYEDQVQEYLGWIEDDRVWVITNAVDRNISHPRILFSDYLFNRTKAYHSNYPFDPQTIKWYYLDDVDYESEKISSALAKTKIFLSPNNTRFKSLGHTFRKNLEHKILQCYQERGYIGNPENNTALFANSDLGLDVDWNSIDLSAVAARGVDTTGYSPPHVAYYRDTFISVYGESIEFGSSIAVTEKTFVPLLKGHFILPFSNCGFVKHLVAHYNIQLPQFIDYSYDQIEDYQQRQQAYFSELDRLLSVDINAWREYWHQNMNILIHNQNIFREKNYHKIDLAALLP
jgi:hypothetical protein